MRRYRRRRRAAPRATGQGTHTGKFFALAFGGRVEGRDVTECTFGLVVLMERLARAERPFLFFSFYYERCARALRAVALPGAEALASRKRVPCASHGLTRMARASTSE